MTPRGFRVVALSIVLGGSALLLSGCSWSDALALGWPTGITPEAKLNRELWIGSVIASFAVGAIVWGLIFWTSAFHRKKATDTELPRQFGYNMPLELTLTVIPFIEFVLNSADVIHGFWVPEFLFKRDVLPEPKANNSDNVFQVSEIQQTGAFVGRCTEMCGTFHAMMNFEVRVVEPNDFKAYIDQRNAGKTNAEALAAINQPPLAITTEPFESRRGELVPQASK